MISYLYYKNLVNNLSGIRLYWTTLKKRNIEDIDTDNGKA